MNLYTNTDFRYTMKGLLANLDRRQPPTALQKERAVMNLMNLGMDGIE